MNVKPARLLVALVAAVALPVFAQNVAVVNGKPIPSARADLIAKQVTAQGQKDSPELRGKIKEDLINREVLAQEAEKEGFGSSAEVKTQMETARQQLDMVRQMILIRALVDDFRKKHPVSDAEVKAEYDKLKEQMGGKEYHARHILVDKEEDAKAIIAKLKNGAKFEDLAKQSKDPGSAANGGDLDWNPPGAFVKPFSDAMVSLKKGQFTDTPVKTQFGYHVIKLEDERPAKIPSLDEVKPQITERIMEAKLKNYQEELKKKAKIQ
jgi:peptidyl-prolyl cis-trans isomerase C